MKTLADIAPEILAEILGEKPIDIPTTDPSKSNLTPLQRKAMEKAYEEGICLDFFPSASKTDSPEGAEEGA